MGIDCYVIPMGPPKSLNLPRTISTIYRIYRIIKKEGIHIIHTDGPRNTFYAGIAAKLARVPLVFHVRVVDKPRFDDKIMAVLTNAFIFVSESARKRFSWLKNKTPGYVIYNGLDIQVFEKYKTEGFSSQDSIEKKEYKIGCIGRIEEGKGQQYLIRAVPEIIKACGAVTFHFVGEEDKAYLHKLQKEILPIADRMKFVGYVDNPYEYMKDFDIIVLPSLSEGFSRVIIESMAMGKPIIATHVGGNSEAILDGITGYLVPRCDAEALADRIISLLQDRETRMKMGKAGYHRVKDDFRLDKNIDDIVKLYDELLCSESGPRRKVALRCQDSLD
jgi:glycosyltransferase involved in cell wall biosynthesis